MMRHLPPNLLDSTENISFAKDAPSRGNSKERIDGSLEREIKSNRGISSAHRMANKTVACPTNMVASGRSIFGKTFVDELAAQRGVEDSVLRA